MLKYYWYSYYYNQICTTSFWCYFYAHINKPCLMKLLKTSLSLLTVVCLLAVACQSGKPKTEEKPAADTMVSMQKDTTVNIFEHMLVDNKKDPSCGMPVTAGISDTAHYKDKVLGFCSKECKDAFLKNPEANLAAAEIKK